MGGLIPTTMLPVLRGKILRPETVHASELIIAVERPLLLDKMPMVQCSGCASTTLTNPDAIWQTAER